MTAQPENAPDADTASGPRRGVLGAILALLAGVFGGGSPAKAGPARAATPEPVTLTAEEALEKAASGELLLIDVRTPAEWSSTGVPEPAALANMQSRDFGQVLMTLLDGDRDRPFAVICRTGRRSSHVANALMANGFTAVHDVPEGMAGSRAGPGWLAKGLPVRRDP